MSAIESLPCTFCNGTGRRPLQNLADARRVTLDELRHQIQQRMFKPAHMLGDFDLKDNTTICLYCQGSGSKQVTVESEGKQ